MPEDYPLPREILREHFPRTADQCNFSGGWGYDVEHAFIDKRIREELIHSRPEGERFCGLDSCTVEQRLLDINGVHHDYILVEVTAYPEKEWNELKADWESLDFYKDDPEGHEANLARKEACKITYQAEYYFNISDFYGADCSDMMPE